VEYSSSLKDLVANLVRLDPSLRPNTESFSLVIRTWLKQAITGNDFVETYNWLEVLLLREENNVQGCSSSPELFTSILKVAMKTSSTDAKILEVAFKTFQKLQSSRHNIDANSYQWLLTIGLRVLVDSTNDDSRNIFLESIIRSCCNEGYVSRGFVAALSKGPFSSCGGWTREESKRVISAYFDEGMVPNSWSRNVNKDHRIIDVSIMNIRSDTL